MSGLFAGQSTRERELVLLNILGGRHPGGGRRRPGYASMTLAFSFFFAPHAPIGVVDPAGVARREAALLEVLRTRPGAALGAIAEAAGHTRSATADRLRRLAARGAVVKVAGRWRLAGEEPVPTRQPCRAGDAGTRTR